MCGIIAYLGKLVGSQQVLEGIKILRNRGYDSVGCCSQHPDQVIKTTKFANQPGQDSFSRFEQSYEEVHGTSNLLCCHCRWATTGVVNDINSHPHQDTILGKIHLVHNGIITNHDDLRNHLQEQGVEFISETDTEVIVNLIAYHYRQSLDLMEAIRSSLQLMEGTWGLVILNVDEPNTMYVCKKGSPVLIAHSTSMCLVASEISGFSNYLKNYTVVPDDLVVKVELTDKNKIKMTKSKRIRLSTQRVTDTTLHATTPAPYPHWTLKEIYEQVESTGRAINFGGRLEGTAQVRLGGLTDHAETLLKIQHLVIIASGTSYHAGLLGHRYFRELSGFQTVRVINASEFTVDDLTPVGTGPGILACSQSGETRDIVACLEEIRNHRSDVPIFSIVNVVESLIAREADCGIYLNSGREVGVAATKSFTSQVVVLILCALWFAQKRNLAEHRRVKLIQALHEIQESVKETLELMEGPCQKIISFLKDKQHLFLLGRDKSYPIALEGALKIKEISYIHAEAYSSASLKHGPLALVEQDTPIIVVRIGDHHAITHLDIAAEETKARGAKLICITDQSASSDLYDYIIPISENQCLAPILSVIPLQYIAYLLTIANDLNPDYPRNLAKCVTTA